MKRIILMLTLVLSLCIGISVYADEGIMKIAMDGEVKLAKDINSGKGISFTLPEYEDKNYYIHAVEIAVFEKLDGESAYHIYKNDSGEESKRQYMENPSSYNIQVEFGNSDDYREKAKYKIGYRYYVRSKDDESIIRIAGEDIKEGWRLIGEADSTNSTTEGFSFYKNANPTMYIECFTYTIHSPYGNMTEGCNPGDVGTTDFPADLFKNGLTVQMISNDFDNEDVLSTYYYLKNHETGELISEGYLPENSTITTEYSDCEYYSLRIDVLDNFGGRAVGEEYVFHLDKCPAYVTSQFDDGGYYLRGGILFSDFYINDNENEVMSEGQVKARILLNEEENKEVLLEQNANGVYRLYETNMPDGRYTIQLAMYDKAGNVSTHTFYQKLDNTGPKIDFLTHEQYEDVTLYSTWMNQYKTVLIELTDEGAGVKTVKRYKNNSPDGTYENKTPLPKQRYSYPVDSKLTGKINYTVQAYDDAKTIDMSKNKYMESSLGNSSVNGKDVWIDITKPTITLRHDDNAWYEAPYTLYANYYDYPSSNSKNDVSGVKEKLYALTDSENTVVEKWNVYEDGVDFLTGEAWYVHFKAVDYAGNEEIITRKVKINVKSEIISQVTPTEDYMHTIHYSEPWFYVVKNTAYNTKYNFGLCDEDLEDIIKTNAKLVSKDNENEYAESEVYTYPNGEPIRDVVFNMSYIKADGNELPDGVYTMNLTITENKLGEDKNVEYSYTNVCDVVIKRNSPPIPIINVESGKVVIDYPIEELSGSLNTTKIRSLYKKQYKMVVEGDVASNTYISYIAPLDVKKSVVTALYTDIAGNSSIATKRIYGVDDDGDGGGSDSILKDGNTTIVEESRSANVYYIGVRRDKTNGINTNVFNFME